MQLLQIHAELPGDRIRKIPAIPAPGLNDYPEKDLEVVIKLRRPEQKKKKKMKQKPVRTNV